MAKKTAPAAAPAAAERKHRDPSQESHIFPLLGRDITLMRPTKGQMFIVLQMTGIADETDQRVQVNLCNDFGVVLRSRFAYDDDERYVSRSLASGDIDLEEYFDLALAMIEQWAPDEKPAPKAPRNGPAKTTRASVRQR